MTRAEIVDAIDDAVAPLHKRVAALERAARGDEEREAGLRTWAEREADDAAREALVAKWGTTEAKVAT